MRSWLTVPLTCIALLGATSAVPAVPAVPAAETAHAPVTSPELLTLGVSSASGVRSVLMISVDGLSPRVLGRLGRTRTPHLHRLLRQGTSTRNARTAVELTTTLPNHTGMATGRRIDAGLGGHGVTWNDERKSPPTVHEAAGEHVASIFTEVDAAGGSTALFAGKAKFSLWNRSWGNSIDRVTIRAKDRRLTTNVRTDLRKHRRALRFWHVATPDRAGHQYGFMKRRYRRAVMQTDAMIGTVLRTINRHPRLRRSVAVVLTSDHGATRGRNHDDPLRLGNQKILFAVKGPGVARGADLYALNALTRRGPGSTQPAYGVGLPPVRNGDSGNLILDLLGLPAIPGSEFNLAQDLSVVRPTRHHRPSHSRTAATKVSWRKANHS